MNQSLILHLPLVQAEMLAMMRMMKRKKSFQRRRKKKRQKTMRKTTPAAGAAHFATEAMCAAFGSTDMAGTPGRPGPDP